MRLMPTKLPSGLCTCQSPIQKSNWRCSGCEHGAGDAAWLAVAARPRRTSPSVFMPSALERARGDHGQAPDAFDLTGRRLALVLVIGAERAEHRAAALRHDGHAPRADDKWAELK